MGERAAKELLLGDEEDGRLDLGDARPGSFQDALNAVGADGVLQAHRFDEEVLHPFVPRDLRARGRAGPAAPGRTAWAELADDVGEDERDLADVVRGGGWEAPLRIDAEHLVLAALGAVPLIEVEAEGLPLSLVRAAEAVTRAAVAPPAHRRPDDDLAGVAVPRRGGGDRDRGAAAGRVRTPPSGWRRSCSRTGWSPTRSLAVLPHLPVQPETADTVVAIIRAAGIG